MVSVPPRGLVGGLSRLPSRSARAQLAPTAPSQRAVAERANGRRTVDAFVSLERQAHARIRTRSDSHSSPRPRSRLHLRRSVKSDRRGGTVTGVSLLGDPAAAEEPSR